MGSPQTLAAAWLKGASLARAPASVWPVTVIDARELEMESFAVDVDPEQIVRWVVAERDESPSSLKTSARRVTETREIAQRGEYHLGDEEREELSEVATVATLEIAPAREHGGWLLTVTVEDEVGPRDVVEADEGVRLEADQQIDLGTFYNEFIRPGRGITSVVAEVDDAAARQDLTSLLDAIERNEHVGGTPSARGRRAPRK